MFCKVYKEKNDYFTITVLSGKSTARGYNAPCFDGMVHYFMGSILIHRDTADGKDRI